MIYQNNHVASDSPITVFVEGFGTQKFEIFINSEYYSVKEINFAE